jgi:hypothetical protein
MANAGSSTSPSLFFLCLRPPSFSVAPKSKPPASGSLPFLALPSELAVESLAFTLPDLHALSSVSQQYHRRSHRRRAREKKVAKRYPLH